VQTKALLATLLFAWLPVGAGCSSKAAPGGNLLPEQANAKPASLTGDPIEHVVMIVQENRSFDNIFAGFPGAQSRLYGYMSGGRRVALRPITFFTPDLPHGFTPAIRDYNGGKMDGFDKGATGSPPVNEPTAPYAYLERSQVAPYWEMAKQYVLADHMFPTMFGASFTAHLDLIATTADLTPVLSEVDFPTDVADNEPLGCDAPEGTTTSVLDKHRQISHDGPFPCFTQFETLADELDAKHITWKYYAPPFGKPNSDPSGGFDVWSEFDAIQSIRYGPDWNTNVVSASPETNVLGDIAKGQLPDVSWVIPDTANSDHASSGHDTGPSWVGTVVNAIGESKYWKSTAIVVLWDDWGGWYDDLRPPYMDYRGLGIRVPCIIISPYVTPHVSHTVYEFGSILKFTEEVFGLKPLSRTPAFGAGYTDGRATSIVDSFDFTQAPRAFVPIKTKYSPAYFEHERHSYEPPDNE
jgi:phospholipase C